jgi:hypothetical protein
MTLPSRGPSLSEKGTVGGMKSVCESGLGA